MGGPHPRLPARFANQAGRPGHRSASSSLAPPPEEGGADPQKSNYFLEGGPLAQSETWVRMEPAGLAFFPPHSSKEGKKKKSFKSLKELYSPRIIQFKAGSIKITPAIREVSVLWAHVLPKLEAVKII